jgi:hypothetical protein
MWLKPFVEKKIGGGISILTIINRISFAVILLVVVLFLIDKSVFGFHFLGAIPLISLVLISNYIGRLERKAGVDKKVRIVGMICFIVTAIIGLLLILSFPEIFNTYGF